MLAKLTQTAAVIDAAQLKKTLHALIVLPYAKILDKTGKGEMQAVLSIPGIDTLQATLKRRGMKLEELAKTPVALNTEAGLHVFMMRDASKPRFERNTVLRKAVSMLMEEQPVSLVLAVFGSVEARRESAVEALQVAWMNGCPLPTRKTKTDAKAKPLAKMHLYGAHDAAHFADTAAVAQGNTLARELTTLPPNELTPKHYRERLRKIAKQQSWAIEEYDMKKLRRMGAGAFVAVAQGSVQGSAPEDAAIVHLSYRPKNPQGHIALVGKGICFDTGGHNLKPAKYMAGMHEDMNGSAVALGLMQVLADRNFPLAIDTWLPIAQNHLSPQAYKQNDVITTLNGTTIEIMHTDAEGRMVLADALTLASGGIGKTKDGKKVSATKGANQGANKAPAKPDLIIDFATLTGSMTYALGSRYSGIFATTPDLIRLAVAAGEASGERVCSFPLDADYEAGLDSKVADIKQCTLDGEADHILAARFLKRFTADLPWLHMDLSASNCAGGLGAVATDLTGFGVAWGVEFIEHWLAMKLMSQANKPVSPRSRPSSKV